MHSTYYPQAFYNEHAPFPVQWLRNLSDAGHIAPGVVDGRDIQDVEPQQVIDSTQAHFFAGVGAWSYALRLAGWPDDVPVWTGSCPCQPFSTAGRRKGKDDARHLWPDWFRLISECRPPVIFGEQVASPDGRAWLAAVSADLETLGYAVAGADLCAASVGAPHTRQRLFFVGYANGDDTGGNGGTRTGTKAQSSGERIEDGYKRHPFGASSGVCCPLWKSVDWVECGDGKARPIEPGTFPLVDGATARVGRLRAYGNAIVPQVAATFIQAAIGAINDASA